MHDDRTSDAERLSGLLLLSRLREAEGAPEPAIYAADEAIAVARRLGNGSGEVEALCLRAKAAGRLGLACDSNEMTTALARIRLLGDVRLEGLVLWTMGNQALDQGDEKEALRLLDESLVCARRAGDDEGEFWALNNIANVLGIQAARHAGDGDHDAARPLVAELVRVVESSMQIASRKGNRFQLAFAISNMADAFIVEGDHARARALVRDYASIALEDGFPRLCAYAHLDEVRMLRAELRTDEAIAVIDSEAHRRVLAGNEDLAQVTETALYEMNKSAGRFEAALRHHELASGMKIHRLTRRAEQQVSVIMARFDIEQAQAAAERARLDAELSARRTQVLELEHEQLQRVAHEDALTGTGNRRAADQALARSLAGSPAASGLVIALIDIDHFKAINDTHGHSAGDAVLATLGKLMLQTVRNRDQVYRHGGEEFLLMLIGTSLDAGLEVCERVRLAIERHDWTTIASGLAVTASFGLARAEAGDSADSLRRRADHALYTAKREGRNRVARV